MSHLPEKIKQAVEKYQCPGCVGGMNTSCYKKSEHGVGCGKHTAGTRVLGHPIGLFWLGMPVGFCRTGQLEHNQKIEMYESLDELNGNKATVRAASVRGVETFYDKYNVPVWKHRTEEGHVLIRGLSPRVNRPFVHILLSDEGFDSIPCVEITKEDIKEMN